MKQQEKQANFPVATSGTQDLCIRHVFYARMIFLKKNLYVP